MRNFLKVIGIILIAAIAFGCGSEQQRSYAGDEDSTRFETVTEYVSKDNVGPKIYFTVVRDKKTNVEYTVVSRYSDYPMQTFVNDSNVNVGEKK